VAISLLHARATNLYHHSRGCRQPHQVPKRVTATYLRAFCCPWIGRSMRFDAILRYAVHFRRGSWSDIWLIRLLLRGVVQGSPLYAVADSPGARRWAYPSEPWNRYLGGPEISLGDEKRRPLYNSCWRRHTPWSARRKIGHSEVSG
jgi:hypothetical protein